MRLVVMVFWGRTYMNGIIIHEKKEARNLKESFDRYMGRFNGRKWLNNRCNKIKISKINQNKKKQVNKAQLSANTGRK